MRLIEDVDDAVVVAEFVRAEVNSPRFGPRVRARLEQDGRNRSILDSPDTSSAADNAYRAAVLHGYRGAGGSAPLLEGLPDVSALRWSRVALSPADLAATRYIDYPYWNALSDGTRSPAHAAERIRAGISVMEKPNDAFHAVAERLCAGEQLGAPVFVAVDQASPLVILEGHTRVTAMLLRPECLPPEIVALVGRAPGVRDWPFYGTPAGAT